VQDDEYLASLQADREKELKAMEEAETRRLQEEAAREAAREEERRREEESRRKLEEEQVLLIDLCLVRVVPYDMVMLAPSPQISLTSPFLGKIRCIWWSKLGRDRVHALHFF
jgi:hypothetical protein